MQIIKFAITILFYIWTGSLLAAADNNHTENVVLLHGIMDSKIHMKKIESDLNSKGYRVLNIDYRSLKYDLATLANLVWADIKEHVGNEKINFVGYSMGGLLTRVIINQYKPKNLGRVVLIGTPNKGSGIADLLKNNVLYKKIFGPAGQQLITDQTALKELLGEINYEVGCIAGTLSIYPISSFLLKKKNDGRVSLESTKLKGMKDHIAINCSHFYLPYSKAVRKQVLSFLRTGYFE